MNQEDPLLPQYQPSKEIIDGTNNRVDTQMDEFEYTGNKTKLRIGNILKATKIIGILTVVVIIIFGGWTLISRLMKDRQTTQTVSTPIPTVSSTATPKPQITYPTEYYELEQEIQAYEQNVTNVDEKRTQIQIQNYRFGIAF